MALVMLRLEAQDRAPSVARCLSERLEDLGARLEVSLVVAHALRDRLAFAPFRSERVTCRLQMNVLDANLVQLARERLLPVLGALAPRHKSNVEEDLHALVGKCPTEVRDTSALVADAVADRAALRGLGSRAR